MRLDGGAIAFVPGRRSWDAGRIVRTQFEQPEVPPPAPSFRLILDEPVKVARAVPGSSGPVTVQDRVYTRTTGASTYEDVIWNWAPAPGTGNGVVSRSSSAPGVLIPDETDSYRWTFVGAGTAELRLMTDSGFTYRRTVSVSSLGSGYTDVLTGYAAGSFRKRYLEWFEARLAGKSPSTALKIFNPYSVGTTLAGTNIVRDPSCWAYGLDLTSISPGNSQARNLWAGVFVTPRDFIHCAHASISAGSKIWLMGSDGVMIERTVAAIRTVAGYTNYYPDVRIGTVDFDLPETVQPAKLPPSNFISFVPGLSYSAPLPAICLDQEEKAIVSDLHSFTESSGMYGAMVYFTTPSDATRLAFHEDKIGGDSGNPAGIYDPDTDEFIVTNVWTFGGAGSGTNLSYHKALIDATIALNGSPYTTTRADWTGRFNTY